MPWSEVMSPLNYIPVIVLGLVVNSSARTTLVRAFVVPGWWSVCVDPMSCGLRFRLNGQAIQQATITTMDRLISPRSLVSILSESAASLSSL